MKAIRYFCIVAALIFLACSSFASDQAMYPALRARLDLADGRIIFADAKILVDSQINPFVDRSRVIDELNIWERKVRAQVPQNASPKDTLGALLKVLYVPGPWNEYRPFTYDFNDPMGMDVKAKQIDNYLSTRKGNCVSMPILVLIIGQRLHLPITLATAPHHVLLKFYDASIGEWIGVEATSGGFKTDASYVRDTHISQRAIDNGIYLRPLSQKESFGVMLSMLMEYYAKEQDWRSLSDVADMAIAINPRDTEALVWKANSFYLRIHGDRAVDAKALIRSAKYIDLIKQNKQWFAAAEKLGWQEDGPDQDKLYLDSIEAENKGMGLHD